MATATGDGVSSDGECKLLSHSFIRSDAARLTLLGVSRLSTGGSSSSSLFGVGDGERDESRDLDNLALLSKRRENAP